MKVTNRYQNPIASMNVDWTDEMVYDLKKYESEAETFIPGCLSENITSIKVSASCKPAFPEDSYHRHGNHAHREILIAPPMGDLSGRRPGLAISSIRSRFLRRLPQARFFRIKEIGLVDEKYIVILSSHVTLVAV